MNTERTRIRKEAVALYVRGLPCHLLEILKKTADLYRLTNLLSLSLSTVGHKGGVSDVTTFRTLSHVLALTLSSFDSKKCVP
jgi:hypothetical protein